jgi:hypothetical protein
MEGKQVMHVFTNKELTAQVADLKEQLAKALAAVAKNRGQSNTQATTQQIEDIYQAYPRKMGKGAAIKAIKKSLNKISPMHLLIKVDTYASVTSWQDKQYLPFPATWFNQERWLDDPKEWEQPTQGNQGPDPTRSILG